MGINWNNIERMPGKHRVFQSLKQAMRPDNYGTERDQWNLTDFILSTDERRFFAWQILQGVDDMMKPNTELGLRASDGEKFRFRLKVLTRQACYEDKNGTRIFYWDESQQGTGIDDSIIVGLDDKPEPGDVVVWKGSAIKVDEHGQRVDGYTKSLWAMQGKPFYNMMRYTVDKDGCIRVPYPYVLSMLQKHGERLVFPQFRKQDKKIKRRKITNWWFKEVPQDYTEEVKRGPGRPAKETVLPN